MITCSYFTNTGKTRKNNEDSLLIGNQVYSSISMSNSVKMEFVDNSPLLFCVADGVGGNTGGEIASHEVLGFICDQVINYLADDIPKIIENAKFHLDDLVQEDRSLLNFGTTLAGILFNDKGFSVFNCGDSRVYRLNDVFFERVSQDHSVVEDLFSQGIISEDEMRIHHKKNIITSGIFGDTTSQKPDIFIKRFSPRKEEFLFICTDGVWETIPIEDFEKLYLKYGVDNFADVVLNECLVKNSTDNLTLIMLHVS